MEKSKKNIVVSMLAIFCLAFLTSFIFCFIYYFSIPESHRGLDPDGYRLLGANLWKGYGLSLNSDSGPTIYRGPLYPAFIALVFFLAKGNNAYAIWIAQCFFHAVTTLLVFLIAQNIWDYKIAIISGFITAIYPLLIWYTPRFWNETILTLFVTLLFYLSILDNHEVIKSTGIGIVLGSLCLTKATFIPLIFLTPLFLVMTFRKKMATLIIPVVALLIIVPWSVRNYLLVKRIVPVHVGAGFNLLMGNHYAKAFFESPFFSYASTWDKEIGKIVTISQRLSSNGAIREMEEETLFLKAGIDEIKNDYTLIIKKILTSGLFFWVIGETSFKTLLIILIKMPVIILAFLGIYHAIRFNCTKTYFAIFLIFFYWFAHLPFIPPARLSTPIMPIMLLLAASNINRFCEKA